MGIESQVVVRFAPQTWGQIDRFQHFFLVSRSLKDHEREALNGVSNHFQKALTLLAVAQSIAPRLEEDDAELREKGYTRALRASEFTAVVESALTAIYSSVDCARKTLNLLYPKAQGLPESTRKTFQNAAAGKIDEKVPQPIRDAFAQAAWFHPLRNIRDALTHTNTGFCSRDRETGRIRYFSAAVRPVSGTTYIEDFVGYVLNIRDRVNEFLGVVFLELNKGLEDTETWQMCGIFSGRVYHRFVRPSEAIDFNSGRCGAFEWFELEGNPTCPFVEVCGAYKRRRIPSDAKEVDPARTLSCGGSS